MDISGLFKGTINQLGNNLDIRAKRHSLITSNIANMDTPGYQAFDIIVKDEMDNVTSQNHKARLTRTHPQHLAGKSTHFDSLTPRLSPLDPNASSENGNTVDVDKEMGRLSQNQLMYNVTSQILAKKFAGLQSVISGGKK